MVIIGLCEACQEKYRIDPRVPEQCVCPRCHSPLRLIGPDEPPCRAAPEDRPGPGPKRDAAE
jgi:hypothetical protein